jgi:hypothetical protein
MHNNSLIIETDDGSVVDLSVLAKYIDIAKNIASISKMMAPVTLQSLIEGQDIAGEMLSKIIQQDVLLSNKLSEAEAVAYLDRSTDFLQSKGLKDTSEARKQYVEMDPDVVRLRNKKAMLEAFSSMLKNKLSVLKQAHDDLKKIHYADVASVSNF